jgi:hypothetical protein
VQPEPVVYREEAVNMLFTIADISEKLSEIIQLLKEDGEEEEERPGA